MRRSKRAHDVRPVVLSILQKDVKARKDDDHLFVEVVRVKAPSLVYTPLAIAMSDENIPCFETVRRSRQWCQRHFPELRPSENVQVLRELKEKEYKEFAIHG